MKFNKNLPAVASHAVTIVVKQIIQNPENSVNPVILYIKTTPSKRIADDRRPNKKDFNPAEVAESLSRYKEAKI